MDRYMQVAIEEAKATLAEGGSPYGAVLIRGETIIGIGRNLTIQNNDPTSHGEIEAIRNAGLQTDYADTVLYTTAFPCIMCAGTIIRMGIPKVIIGAGWAHNQPTRELLRRYDIELVELDLDECHQLYP